MISFCIPVIGVTDLPTFLKGTNNGDELAGIQDQGAYGADFCFGDAGWTIMEQVEFFCVILCYPLGLLVGVPAFNKANNSGV